MADQLPLPFYEHAEPSYAAAEFVAAPSNEEALAWLRRAAEWPAGRLAVWGEAGCGKTHLLRVWAARSAAAIIPAAGLSGVPELPDVPALAIDDAEAAAEETALLHLLNAAQERGRAVLMAARAPPARWATRLPDLASRLRAGGAVRIQPPDDALLRTLLARHLLAHRLRVPEEVQDWLLLRLPRTAAAMREAAFRLDRAAFAGRSAVTRAVAARVLSELAGPAMEQNDEISPEGAGPASPAAPSLL